MKKLLLILLCVPLIGFAQEECGKLPQENLIKKRNYNSYIGSNEYRKYQGEIKKYEKCMFKNIDELYTSSTFNKNKKVLNKENAYLKLKLLHIIKNFEPSVKDYVTSRLEKDNW